MLGNFKVHCKSNDLFSILREHSGKYEFGTVMSVMIRYLQGAVNRIHEHRHLTVMGSSSLRGIRRIIAECSINTDIID